MLPTRRHTCEPLSPVFVRLFVAEENKGECRGGNYVTLKLRLANRPVKLIMGAHLVMCAALGRALSRGESLLFQFEKLVQRTRFVMTSL